MIGKQFDSSRALLPVLHGQTAHTLEFGSVVGDDDQPISQSNRRDHQVIRTDLQALGRQVRPSLTILLGCEIVKRERRELLPQLKNETRVVIPKRRRPMMDAINEPRRGPPRTGESPRDRFAEIAGSRRGFCGAGNRSRRS
jgi:hypothetical protein